MDTVHIPATPSAAPKLERIGTGTMWAARSKSRPGRHHIVFTFLNDEGVEGVACSCEGYQYQNKCWHVNAVIESL